MTRAYTKALTAQSRSHGRIKNYHQTACVEPARGSFNENNDMDASCMPGLKHQDSISARESANCLRRRRTDGAAYMRAAHQIIVNIDCEAEQSKASISVIVQKHVQRQKTKKGDFR